MSAASPRTLPRRKAAIWCAVGAGLLLVAAANSHLVYVAITSQPACIDHVRQGDGDASRLSAAQSACSPR